MNRKDIRILYITQKIDLDEDLLAQFYCWLKKIVGQIKFAYVLCLYRGRDDLPANVLIRSMGKERGNGRLGYLINFYSFVLPLIFKRKIDLVFVHMNEIYLYLLWPLTKLMGIPMVWWKAHGHLSRRGKFGRHLVDIVFTSSPSGYAINTAKRRIIGQGTDTERFVSSGTRDKVKEIITVSRISPVKNIETMIEAANILINQKGYDLNFTVYGAPPLKEQEKYLTDLKSLVKKYQLEAKFKFPGALPYHQILEKFQNGDVFVNTSDTGSLDKAVLEAMSCEKIVINSNRGYKEILADYQDVCLFEQGNYLELVKRLEKVIKMSQVERQLLGKKLRAMVVKDHNVNVLVERILKGFEDVTK